MDEEDGNNFQNRLSRSDRKRSSVMSLERRSNYDFYRDYSLNKRLSYVQVMSLEGSQKNQDIYDVMLSQEKRKSLVRNSNNVKVQMEEQSVVPNRKSSSNKLLRHECSCVTYCLEWFCPCFNGNNEMCMNGFCCDNCIKNKLQRLKNQTKHHGCFCQNSKCQNSYCKCFKNGKKCDPMVCLCSQCKNRLQIYDIRQHQHIQRYVKHSDRLKKLITEKGYSAVKELKCSCKKSSCLKNYCECYYYGVGCGPQCKCKNCRNLYEEEDDIAQVMIERERYGRIDSESDQEPPQKQVNIDDYFNQDNYQSQDLPQSMEFQDVSFKNAFRISEENS